MVRNGWLMVVLGGLIPIASEKNNGLLSKDGYKKLFLKTNGQVSSLTQICTLNNNNNFFLSVIGGGAAVLISITACANIEYIQAKKISGVLGAAHFKLYKDSQGIYFKSVADAYQLSIISCDNTNDLLLIESQKDMSELVELGYS